MPQCKINVCRACKLGLECRNGACDQTCCGVCAQACCTLQPAFPDLPDEHSETVETVMGCMGSNPFVVCAQACCTLQPAFPDLPDEHSETIEANIVNQNFTFVARHMFSRSFGVVRTRIQ